MLLLSGQTLLAQENVPQPQNVSAADLQQFQGCMRKLGQKAVEKGIQGNTFSTYTSDLVPDMSVLTLLDHQPEFTTPIWDYMASLVDDERVSEGRRQLAQWRSTLTEVGQAYGVDAETVVAVWGVESNYGATFGQRPLVRSLATLSCFGRRQAFFQGEFWAALKILQNRDVNPEHFKGSWAGAFGHTQFMPSTFLRIAVDFDGDGRRDLIDSVPDALASTANYLARSGWASGQPWGYEVVLPQGFDSALSGRRNKHTVAFWSDKGITLPDGGPLPDSSAQAGLLLPAGVEGPAFLVFRNFDAIYSYNAAESYALAIAHLSDRLRGGGAFITSWPTDDPGLSRAQRKEVQTLLLLLGYDIGEVDGIIGENSRRAIREEQAVLGMNADGRAGEKFLLRLRAKAASQPE